MAPRLGKYNGLIFLGFLTLPALVLAYPNGFSYAIGIPCGGLKLIHYLVAAGTTIVGGLVAFVAPFIRGLK